MLNIEAGDRAVKKGGSFYFCQMGASMGTVRNCS
uniref:Uncharacterized protein n=1 Tax=Anguilla anguilla TaxID=7936 RepID=A0A0E9PT21_ANGAN